MTAATLQQARAAQSKLAAALETVEEVLGLGIAVLDGGFGLKVNVESEAVTSSIPSEVDGVAVIVEVVGEITPL